MALPDSNVPVLGGGAGRVVVTSRKVIAPAGVDVRPGGLDITGADCHLRVVDGMTGEAWLVPCSPRAVSALREALAEYTLTNVKPIGG